jgi:2-polyprenyl-3-methyl-5-hydroxy-6-metoxy-1,4-benzoquinol methylase
MKMFDMSRLSEYPNLAVVVDALLAQWPDHASYCAMRFRDDPPGFMKRSDELAGLVIKLAEGKLDAYCQDYKWMCAEFVKEEIYFRRNKRYRLSTFKEAYDQVYNDKNYMSAYVNGILISQLIWTPHARAFDYFRTHFLPGNPEQSSHLEIGPGHGLFLYFASQEPRVRTVEAWDVSESSIAATRHALDRLGVTQPVSLTLQDVLLAPQQEARFDSAIISEVLEHLEEPGRALDTLRLALKPGGRLFINVPINSPAPDHIYLWRTTEEFTDFVRTRGFEIESSQLLPITGYSLERAVQQDLSISCVLIARKP